MIIYLEDPSVDIAHNNAKQISSVVMHSLMVDIHTLLPSQCQMLSETYAYHMAWQNFYTSQINDWSFHQAFCFVHNRFIFKFSKTKLMP